jgi:hypothetical protein
MDTTTRATLRAAANNLQRFCVIFFGPEFKDALMPLIDALDNDAYLWEDYENRYIIRGGSLCTMDRCAPVTTGKHTTLIHVHKGQEPPRRYL